MASESMTLTDSAIAHHVPDDLLMAYSAGALPEGFALAVAAHLGMCDTCRAAAGTFDAVGGAVLERCAAPPLAEGRLEAALAQVRGPLAREAPPDPAGKAALPAPLPDYVAGSLEEVRWRPAGLGVRQARLRMARGASARLLRIPGGTAIPDHGHRGLELTLVLRGAFRDGAARFGPGDLQVAGRETSHTPTAEPDAECLCLAVTDAPLRFSGLVPRLAQRFLGI